MLVKIAALWAHLEEKRVWASIIIIIIIALAYTKKQERLLKSLPFVCVYWVWWRYIRKLNKQHFLSQYCTCQSMKTVYMQLWININNVTNHWFDSRKKSNELYYFVCGLLSVQSNGHVCVCVCMHVCIWKDRFTQNLPTTIVAWPAKHDEPRSWLTCFLIRLFYE